MKVVVFLPNLIGDTVMATPTLRTLRRSLPGARITGIVRPSVAPTLDGNPWLDELVRFDHRSDDRGHHAGAVVRRLKSERPDVALLLPNSFRSALVAWRGGSRRRVGYARGGRRLLLTDRLVPPRDAWGRFLPVPAVEYYLRITEAMGCRTDSTRLELFTTAADESAADAAWEALGIAPGTTVVSLNTGGAFGPAKSWPAPFFSELARRLAREQDVTCLVLCGPAERDISRAIADGARHPRVVSLADQRLGIGLSKACVRRSRLLVTTDSGPRHFAAAFGVPVVTLFGPTHIAWTRTYHPQAIHLQQPVPCGPCQKGVCPLGHHRCMTELNPDRVFAAAARLLGARREVVR